MREREIEVERETESERIKWYTIREVWLVFFFIFCKMLQSCPLLIHSRNMHTHRTHMHITPVIIRCVRYSCLNVSFFILLFEIWIAHTVCKPKEMNIFNSQIVVVDERRYFAFSGVLCVCTCVCACRDFSAFWIYTYMPVLKEEKKIMFWLPIQRRCRHHHFLHKYTSKRTHTLFVHHCKLLTLRVYIYICTCMPLSACVSYYVGICQPHIDAAASNDRCMCLCMFFSPHTDTYIGMDVTFDR